MHILWKILLFKVYMVYSTFLVATFTLLYENYTLKKGG